MSKTRFVHCAWDVKFKSGRVWFTSSLSTWVWCICHPSEALHRLNCGNRNGKLCQLSTLRRWGYRILKLECCLFEYIVSATQKSTANKSHYICDIFWILHFWELYGSQEASYWTVSGKLASSAKFLSAGYLNNFDYLFEMEVSPQASRTDKRANNVKFW